MVSCNRCEANHPCESFGGGRSVKAFRSFSSQQGTTISELEVTSPPCTNYFQYGQQGQAVVRDRVVYTGRHTPLLPSYKYSIPHQFLEMPDQHPLSDPRDAAMQFTGSHRPVRQAPQDGSFPSSVDNRQHGVNRALGDFLLETGMTRASIVHSLSCTDNFVSTAP